MPIDQSMSGPVQKYSMQRDIDNVAPQNLPNTLGPALNALHPYNGLTSMSGNPWDPSTGGLFLSDPGDLSSGQIDPAMIALGDLPQLPNGFQPEMLAGARAQNMEDEANAGAQSLSQAKIALDQGGLSGSPAAAALRAGIARQTGMNQTAGNRQISISNMAQANQMALQRASMMFSAMQGNQAAANAAQGANFGNQNSRWQTGVNQLMGGGGSNPSAWGAGNPTQSASGNIFSNLSQGIGSVLGQVFNKNQNQTPGISDKSQAGVP